MQKKYYLLSKKTKIFIVLICILLATGLELYLNKNYLQQNMIGTWHSKSKTSNTEISTIDISTKAIKFNDKIVSSIKYGSKSSQNKFKRKSLNGNIIYLFNFNDNKDDYYNYFFIFDRKNPNYLSLGLFDGESITSYVELEKDEK